MYVYVVQMYIEYCEGGALDRIMHELERALSEPQLRFVAHEVADALTFLHARGIIHRDLKAGNLLLTADADVRLGKCTRVHVYLYSYTLTPTPTVPTCGSLSSILKPTSACPRS